MQKDGDRYIYPYLLRENCKIAHKSIKRSYKTFKPSIHNVVNTGITILKKGLSSYFVDCVRLARYFGKMYSRYLFSYVWFPVQTARSQHSNAHLDLMQIHDIRYEPHTLSSRPFRFFFPKASLILYSCEVVSSSDMRKNEAKSFDVRFTWRLF